MSELVREVIDGKPATVAYMDRMGGNLVPQDEAKVVVVRYDDGHVQFLVPADKGTPDA